jgi:hypothetical protein
MGDLTEHFSASEFQCKCGCKQSIIQPSFVKALEDLRQLIGVPITITSGYRCPEHNKAVGGAPKSFHTQGMAADIRCIDLPTLYLACLHVPAIKGIGIYLRPGGWLHVDTRKDEARWAQDGLRRPIDFKQAVKILFESQRGVASEGKAKCWT